MNITAISDILKKTQIILMSGDNDMNDHLCIRKRRIMLWIIVSLVLAGVVFLIDISVLQKNPFLIINNYSDVVISIWQIQTTIASLTLASTAFILSKIENSYYGISIKNLLHLSRKWPRIGLSFWEKIICSVLVPIITLLFVCIDNITSVMCLLFFTGYLATSILVECINVITKSEIYSDWAKNEVDRLINVVCQNDSKDEQQLREAKNQMSLILDGISAEVSSEIRKNVYIIENNTYIYFLQLYNKTSNGELIILREQMLRILIDWLRLSIDTKTDYNIGTVLRVSYPDNFYSTDGSYGIDLFMYSYYRGDVSTTCFDRQLQSVINFVHQGDKEYYAVALYMLKNAIDNADTETFIKLVKAVWRSDPYSSSTEKSSVLITAIAYLYYMALKEDYLPIERGTTFVEKLKSFSEAIILEQFAEEKEKKIVDILSDTELMLSGTSFLIKKFNEPFGWEYLPAGEAKTCHLDRDMLEFLAFYLAVFFKEYDTIFLKKIELVYLLKIAEHFDTNGTIRKEKTAAFESFCKWIGKDETLYCSNKQFYTELIEIIKEKMLEEAVYIREKHEIWNKKIGDMEEIIFCALSDSLLHLNEEPSKAQEESINIEQFLPLKHFSEFTSLYGNDEVIRARVEEELFIKLKNREFLIPFEVNTSKKRGEIQLIAFDEMLQRMRDIGININKSFNYKFYDNYLYGNVAPHIREKVQEYNKTIENVGRWHSGYSNNAIYVDKKLLENVGFYANKENFIKISEELTSEELMKVCERYKTEEGYVFIEHSNSPEIPYSQSELLEFLKVSMIKVHYSFPVELPRDKIGFYTVTRYTDK